MAVTDVIREFLVDHGPDKINYSNTNMLVYLLKLQSKASIKVTLIIVHTTGLRQCNDSN